MRKYALGLAADSLLVALGGYLDGGEDPPASGAGIVLSIEVRVDEGATPVEMTLECDPAGGDHPQPAEACAKLKASGVTVFDPVPDKQPCTMIFGGPQTAVVRGVWDGEKVDAAFSRNNGCEIDRWEKLGTTFFDIPLQ